MPTGRDARIFDLTSSRDMCEKLDREVERIRATTVRADLADHCFNAAVTAWHLVEWVWSDIENEHFLKLTLAKEAGIPPSKFNRYDFARHVSSEGQCPALRICRIIATSSKHGGFEVEEDDPEFKTVASAFPGADHAFELDDDGMLKLEKNWSLKIIVGQERIPALHLFERVLGYWTNFIYGYEVAAMLPDD